MAANDDRCVGCGKVKYACGIADGASAPLFERHYWVFLGISGFMLATALVFEHVFHDLILLHLFAIGSIIFSGHDVFKASYREIMSKQLGASTLMVVAAIGSLFIAHGTEGAMAIFLYSLAEKLEGISAGKARDAVSKLLQLSPDTALVKDDSGIKERPTGSVKVGDTVVVKPGAKVPLDGIITKGKSFFDTHAITGESIPRLQKPGDRVHASSINGDSLVEIQVTAGKSDTLVARITESINEAQQNKSKTEKFIDRFARYYTPVIFSVAVAVMVLLPVLGNRSIIDSVYTGFILLVISCPCALTLSSPLSMVAALTKLSREGILVKGGKFIERLKQVDTFGFDKTATITEGKLKVHDNVAIAPGWSKRENLQVIASLEENSDHPIAKAIVEAARSMEGNGIDLENVAGFTEIKGKGITGAINGKTYIVGSPTLFQETEIPVPKDTLARYTFEGKTP
ncbi:HAD-IC family P-type ATPase, partial [Candidatus Bathyarchaeota archaeon]|nr:HAD-IC family P-type ATPase [Candidatus Bathyarchaeota archaeon]